MSLKLGSVVVATSQNNPVPRRMSLVKYLGDGYFWAVDEDNSDCFTRDSWVTEVIQEGSGCTIPQGQCFVYSHEHEV